MKDAADSVATGEVTQAIRNTNSQVGAIAAGDWIGIVKGDGIAAISGSPAGASIALLTELVRDSAELVTVVVGSDAAAEDTAAIEAWLGNHRGDLAVEIQYGGQPLYPYLFGVE
jgi:dihydroxyacetone kinase-like predicted kinase